MVDYPDSPGSDSVSPGSSQASPEGRPGPTWPDGTPEKPGPCESDPDFPAKDLGSGSKLGGGRDLGPDSGFKSIKSKSFGSPCSSVDMFADSSDTDKRVRAGSDSDSDVILSSLPQTKSLSKMPVLRLPRLSTSSLSNQESQVETGRKRKGSKVVLSSSSGSASEPDDRMEMGSGVENSGKAVAIQERAGEFESGARGVKPKPEAKPKGKAKKPGLNSPNFTSDSLNDFRIPKRKDKMNKIDIKQISILEKFENKNQVSSYKNPKNPAKPGRGRGSSRGSGRSRSSSTRSRKPENGVPYAEMVKHGFSKGLANKQGKQDPKTPKLPPWIPSGPKTGDFPPLPVTGYRKVPAQGVKTVDKPRTDPADDSVPKPSTSTGAVGTSKNRRPLMLPSDIVNPPPKKPLQTPSHKVQKAPKIQSTTRSPPKKNIIPKPPPGGPTVSLTASKNLAPTNPPVSSEPRQEVTTPQDKPKFNFKNYVNQMSAPGEQVDLKTNFQLSLSLGEKGDLARGPLPPPPPVPPFPLPPRKPVVLPLQAAPMLRYETKIFEMEVEDRGLRWKRVTKKNPKIEPGDESFNLMCQPFLENRLTSLLVKAGGASDNKIVKMVEKGVSEHENPFVVEDDDQVPRFEVPDSEFRPFGTPIAPFRTYALAPGYSPYNDPNMRPSLQTLTCNSQLCNTCFGIAKKINSPGPRLMPDPTKFQFRKSETPRTPVSERRIHFDTTTDLANSSGLNNSLSNDLVNKPSDSDLTGLQSVSYTTKSGRVTTRLTPTREGRMAPPPPPPPARPSPTESPASSLGAEGPRPVTAEEKAKAKRDTLQGRARAAKKKEKREVGASPGKAVMARKARDVVGFNPKKASKKGRGVRANPGSGFRPTSSQEEEEEMALKTSAMESWTRRSGSRSRRKTTTRWSA